MFAFSLRQFSLLFLSLLLAVALITSGCSEDSADVPDGDADIEANAENDTEAELGNETETELETEPEPECTGQEPICEGESVVSCEDGQRVVTPCEEGTYCNYGTCAVSTVTFPTDAGFHAERSEWWYYTGHLDSEGGRFGFEVTIFQYDLESTYGVAGYGYMCHVGITDESAGEHYHTDSLLLDTKEWTNDPIVLELDNCRFEIGGDGKDHIIGEIPEGKEKDDKISPWRIDITVEPVKRPALHGGDGIIPMSDSGGQSYYYSYTLLTADGTLSTPGGEFSVSGQAWMDHQWGQFDIVDFKGWDWWSMQFEDGWEIMLFQFTDWEDQLAAQAGTLIDPDGNLTELEGIEDFTIESQRSWESPHTDGIYPLDWEISIPKMNWQLSVTTLIDDQEMYNHAQNYWEGNTFISGTRDGVDVSGVGYTELTGYATDILDPK